MEERYLTSFEALAQGLLDDAPGAVDASMLLLETAHDRSRTRIVTFVSECPIDRLRAILERWFVGSWSVQSAAWWVVGYLERVAVPKAAKLRGDLGLLERMSACEQTSVTLQASSWLYCALRSSPRLAESVDERTKQALLRWLKSDDVFLALAALQCLIQLDVHVAKEDAARVVLRGAANAIPEADVIGMRCGFIESAVRLVDEIFRDGPFTLTAVAALCEALPKEAETKLRGYKPSRWGMSDAAIHVATVLAAHGDVRARDQLERATQQRDPQKKALAWSGWVRASVRLGDSAQTRQIGKLLLRQSESVRAWVWSGLDPSCAIQGEWLLQAKTYGTLEEQEAVVDAMRAFSLRAPLVPQGSSS